jgi:hypothetical protein
MPFGRKEVKEVQAGAIRLFNIDLHLAVIADVKDVLFRSGLDSVATRCCILNQGTCL